MKFVKVEELPKRMRTNVRVCLDEFMSMGVKIARVDYDADEYMTAKSACGSFKISAKKGGYPIDARMINGEVYLIRRDM